MGLRHLWKPWSSPPPSKKAKVEHSSDEREEDSADTREKLQDRIVLGECLEFMKSLPSEIVDCTVTSPPYNKGRKGLEYSSCKDSLPWDEYIANQTQLLNELYRITKPGGHLWYIHQVQFRARAHELTFHPISWILNTPWTVRQEITWGKPTNQLLQRYRFMVCDERIYWLRKEPGPPFELSPQVAKWGTIWRPPLYSMASIFPHPSAFPIYLVLSILHATNLPNGSLVFDPYGGTGTTAKAAQIANHHYLTVEMDKKYVKGIKRRLGKTINEDEWWITLLMKQIADGTLNLSMDLPKAVQDNIIASADFGYHPIAN